MNRPRTRVLEPGQRIRVLVVDDSAVIRHLIVDALEQDPLFEVASVAASGIAALARIRQVNPDVVTLDIEMPGMDGLEILRRLRSEFPALPVVMFSAFTEQGASAALEALSLGADDCVAKVSHGGPAGDPVRSLQSELIPKIRQFFSIRPHPAPSAARPSFPENLAARAEAIAIAVSTGGPAALNAILPRFPADFPLPIFIVQHMPPLFTRLLAERLDTACCLRVREASTKDKVEPGSVYLAPGDFHMRVRRGAPGVEIVLGQDPPQNSCRPAADVLFSSVAEVYGGAAIGAVLTGMGQDGLCGARQLKARGARMLVQNEASSIVWGMPGAVAAAGLADEILPLEGIVPAILSLVGC